ncbi:hypothetical protein [Flavobacterium phycosphaerae]|uniref:hypothetical protein n=1 Tax=Flavobacterium phycosphaerae TaxID=2697515 RepID=UPI00138A4728|nr:hypothetical protein [Flavobacterium phycosphaerae]
MKKIKLLVLLLTITIGGLYSCTDSNPVENEVVTSKSIALRTTLNELKKTNNLNGKLNKDQTLCFQFVYPISLSYNDGTVVTVNSYQGLLDVLTNESSNLYIDGIAFPFQVQEDTAAVTTISNEAEFYALIQGCTFETVNDCVFDFTCYDIVYPIEVINANGATETIETQTELMQLVSDPNGNNTYQLNIVFPISVIQNNQTMVINDLYEFFDLNNDCEGSACICTADYAPVCVQTANGIVQFSNACHAECAGYTANDFVDCNSTSPCNCPTDINPVCVQTPNGIVQFDNACLAQCEGFTANDFVNCNPTPTNTFGQLLGTCFNVVYPVEVQNGGSLITINNDGELLQYWWPNQAYFPALNYPVTITVATPVGNTTIVIANEAAFESVIASHCN